MYAHCGLSMLGIAKLFKVSDVAVLKWIRKFSDQIILPEEKAKMIQIDDCKRKKNPIWIWRAINGISRRATEPHFGSRSDADLKKLVEMVDDGTCEFVTDGWGGFFRLLPPERHFFGKDLTFPIEATNSDIRHRLARFKRKTKASSRSLDMVGRSLLLFHYFQDYPSNIEPLLNSFLSFFG